MSSGRSLAWTFATLCLALAARPAPAAQGPQSLSMNATADGVAVVAGRPIQFTDASTGNASSWEWDFTHETGVSAVDSRAQHPVWTFAEAGVWSVRLEACNLFGCGSAIKEIEVLEPCSLTPDLVIEPLLAPITDSQSYEACRSITAGTGFQVMDHGAVTFRAGRSVVLGNGFSVGSGGSFKVVIDPLLDIP